MTGLGEHKLEYETVGPFVTHVWLHHKDGHNHYAARPVRKGVRWIRPMQLSKKEQTEYVVCAKKINYWVAVLFMVGSSLFAIPGFLPASLAPAFNVIFFCGSIFFTSAAYLQLVESINKDITNPALFRTQRCHWIRWAWRPKNLGYLSSLVQFVGTLLFNVNCISPFFLVTPLQMDVVIWGSGMLGSICFLISCAFAWLEISRDPMVKPFRSEEWWIVWVNIAGSIAFQVSSAVAFYLPQTGDVFAPVLASVGLTFGAICFFIGAFLLRVEDAIDSQKFIGGDYAQ
ncbi:hypothetical protein SAMN02745161_2063 [Halodesulfovibrio marinisediminis DSM 17456]|uniref:YrhK-like protein n=2 Tax=Halodesulfovibrio marinisediminis TaxID=458711 RepID=A0A1N6H876_9BACT|nr:hypothetical protein SAMN02745161_2063 [Halodesulfovibrio marinisediminis DSM 17456]